MPYVLIYEQNWTAGMADSLMGPDNYRSSAQVASGGDTPSIVYPELAAGEGNKVTAALGPAGESVLDIDDGSGNITAEAGHTALADVTRGTPYAIPASGTAGDYSDNYVWWDADAGKATVQYKFQSTRLSTYKPSAPGLLRLGGGNKEIQPNFNAISRGGFLLGLDPHGVSEPTPTDYEVFFRYFHWPLTGSFPDSTDLNSYVVLTSDSIGGIPFLDAWHTFDVRWQCGTVTASAPGVWTDVASDGYIQLYWNDVLIYDVQNAPIVMNVDNDFGSGANADFRNALRNVWFGDSYSWISTNFRLYQLTECASFTPTYEDPCSIRTPIVVRVVSIPTAWDPDTLAPTAYDYITAATTALRDHDYIGSGWKSPRLLSWGPIVKAASNWLTGALEAQTSPARLADTDGVIRAQIAARYGSVITAEFSDYLVSPTQRAAAGDPRLIAQGRITADDLTDHRTIGLTGTDVIGSTYNILSGERMCPQRLIEPDFPGFGLTGTDTLELRQLVVPIIGGTHSDEDAAVPGGRVPVIYVGRVMCLDSVNRHCGLVSGHANYLGILAMYDNTSPTPVAVSWGSNAWAPGQTGWASVNPSGAELYTVINGRTYTVVFFDDTLGGAFLDKSKAFYVNTHGFCVDPNGDGGEVTDLHDQYLHCFVNDFVPLEAWQTGELWNDACTTEFEFYPGGPVIHRVDADSWETAKAVWLAAYAGWVGDDGNPQATRGAATNAVGAFVLGANGRPQSLRSVLAQFSAQTHTSLGIDQYQRYFVKMFDPRPESHASARKVTHKTSTLNSQPVTSTIQPELLCNNFRAAGAFNYRTNAFEALAQIGDVGSFLRFPGRLAEEAWGLISDFPTGRALMSARLMFRRKPRRLVKWRESLCGLTSNILDVIRLTHYNGEDTSGYENRHIWIQRQTLNSDGSVDFEGYDVEDLISEETLNAVMALSGSGHDSTGSGPDPFVP